MYTFVILIIFLLAEACILLKKRKKKKDLQLHNLIKQSLFKNCCFAELSMYTIRNVNIVLLNFKIVFTFFLIMIWLYLQYKQFLLDYSN